MRTPSTAVSGIVVADLDNDGRPDLLLLHPRGISVQRQTETGVFVPFASQPSIAIRPDSAALLDADHDGDLDILVGGVASRALLERPRAAQKQRARHVHRRHQGRRSRRRAVEPSRLCRSISTTAATWTSSRCWNDARPSLFQNQRNESFRDVAADTGLASWRTEGAVAIATCDLNKDGFADFIAAGGPALASLALSDGRGRFATKDGPAGSQHLTAVQCADYDNDGLLDVIGAGAEGLRVLAQCRHRTR